MAPGRSPSESREKTAGTSGTIGGGPKEQAAELRQTRRQLEAAERELNDVLLNVYNCAGSQFWGQVKDKPGAPAQERLLVAGLLKELQRAVRGRNGRLDFTKAYTSSSIYDRLTTAQAWVDEAKIAANIISHYHNPAAPFKYNESQFTSRWIIPAPPITARTEAEAPSKTPAPAPKTTAGTPQGSGTPAPASAATPSSWPAYLMALKPGSGAPAAPASPAASPSTTVGPVGGGAAANAPAPVTGTPAAPVTQSNAPQLSSAPAATQTSPASATSPAATTGAAAGSQPSATEKPAPKAAPSLTDKPALGAADSVSTARPIPRSRAGTAGGADSVSAARPIPRSLASAAGAAAPESPAEGTPATGTPAPLQPAAETAAPSVKTTKSLAEAEAELEKAWATLVSKQQTYSMLKPISNPDSQALYDRLKAFYGEISAEKCPGLYAARLAFVSDLTGNINAFLSSTEQGAYSAFGMQRGSLNAVFLTKLQEEAAAAEKADSAKWAQTGQPQAAAAAGAAVDPYAPKPKIDTFPRPDTVLPFSELVELTNNYGQIERKVLNRTDGIEEVVAGMPLIEGRDLSANNFEALEKYKKIHLCVHPRVGDPMGTDQTEEPPDLLYGIDVLVGPVRRVELLEGYKVWKSRMMAATTMKEVDAACTQFDGLLTRLCNEPVIEPEESIKWNNLRMVYDTKTRRSALNQGLEAGKVTAEELGIGTTRVGVKHPFINWIQFFTGEKDGFYHLAQLESMVQQQNSNLHQNGIDTLEAWLKVMRDKHSKPEQVAAASKALNDVLGKWAASITPKKPHGPTVWDYIKRFGTGVLMSLLPF